MAALISGGDALRVAAVFDKTEPTAVCNAEAARGPWFHPWAAVPQAVTHLWFVAGDAALLGFFIGNEIVARFSIRVGRQIRGPSHVQPDDTSTMTPPPTTRPYQRSNR